MPWDRFIRAQIREIVVEPVAQVKRHNGVLIEDLRQKLDLVVEGQQNISRQSNAMRALLCLSHQR